MIKPRLMMLVALAVLADCHRADEENVQMRAENASRELQQKMNEIDAEAANATDAAIAPLDNESEAFLNQANGSAPGPGQSGSAPGNVQ